MTRPIKAFMPHLFLSAISILRMQSLISGQDFGPGLVTEVSDSDEFAIEAIPLESASITSKPQPFYNLLSAQEDPTGGALIRVKSSSEDVGLMICGRIAIDSVTSNGSLLPPYGYIFLGPDTPESQWTNVISARQSTFGFLFTGPNLGNFKTLARYEAYFLSSVMDANVYRLAQYFLYAKLFDEDRAFTAGLTNALVTQEHRVSSNHLQVPTSAILDL